MSLFGRLMDSMRVNSDEEDDEYFEEEEEYTEKPQKRLPNLIRKRDEEEEEEEPKPRLFSRKVAPVKKSGSLEVALVKPSVFDDAKTIVDDLLSEYGRLQHGDCPEDHRLHFRCVLQHERKASEDLQLYLHHPARKRESLR